MNQHEHQKHANPLNLMFSKKMKTLCYQNKTKRSNKKMKTLCCQNKTKRSKKECVLSNSNIGMFFHKIIMSECGMSRKMKGGRAGQRGGGIKVQKNGTLVHAGTCVRLGECFYVVLYFSYMIHKCTFSYQSRSIT